MAGSVYLINKPPFHYTLFHKNAILKDTVLNLEIRLAEIFN